MSQDNWQKLLLFIERTRLSRRGCRHSTSRLIEITKTMTKANPRRRSRRRRTKHESKASSSWQAPNSNNNNNNNSSSRTETQVGASQSSSYSVKPATTSPPPPLISIPFIFTFCLTTAAVAVVLANGQQPQLPTVIVRGFLNYRTTVDGTVLLFTPDAGQQASSTAAATNSIQPTSTAALPFSVTTNEPKSGAGQSSLVFTESGGQQIEPTSVHVAHPLQTSHVDSSSFRRGQSSFVHTAVQPIAEGPEAPSAVAQADEWRPVQATPPLRMAQPATEEQPRPSVQADDLAGPPSTESTPSLTGPAAEPSAPANPRGPKRPSLGLSGQGLRPRVPGTAGATSPSLQTRQRAGTTGGINGIRRPGLTTTAPPTSASTNSATPSDPAALANAASAFQNRLASANTRLRNRFKHRQNAQAESTGGSSGNSTTTSDGHKPANNLIAPESLLDVASSIEQPTSAARSAALAPSGTSGQLGSSGPAVGSEEILAPAVGPAASFSGQQQGEISPASDESSGAAITVPVVASSDLAAQPEAELNLEPISPEQQAGSASLSRAGEQRPSDDQQQQQQQRPKVLSGQLQQGLLSSGPLQMDTIFQNDQPGQLLSSSSSSSSDEATPPAPARPPHKSTRPALAKPAHHHRPHGGNNNEKLNGWLGAHHNKFVPRPAGKPADSESAGQHLSHALAANLNQLLPASSSTPQPPLAAAAITNASEPALMSASLQSAASDPPGSSVGGGGNGTTSGATSNATDITPMQTITRTYSTILETSKTRLVPMQVKSSAAIYTITEDYVMTKVMTAYQTLPAGAEFLLAEPALSTRAPYEVFESTADSKPDRQQVAAPTAPAVAAPSGGGGHEAAAPIDTQEQPISLDTSHSPKSANNWLHDFSNPDDPLGGNDNFRSTQEQTNMLAALLEQQARGGGGDQPSAAALSQLLAGNAANPNEPLDQLASQLDPAALLADGTINIPDLNNPLVLAAAIQNPQLAAVILAAQQLKLKQRQQFQQRPNQVGSLQQLQLQQLAAQQAQQHLQPSYSTSFSTTVRPSTYVARDTMYTTRLVSFRDGRTVRTRTVSEPGSVIEQTLTTIVTETIPVTITIRPTAVAGGLSVPNTAAAGALGSQTGGQQSNQATINNALFATQLANILARRQQATQLQTSFQNPALMNLGASGGQNLAGAAATPQQLLALQQLFARQKQQSQAQQQQQFQPNFNQLLASINQNQQVGGTNSSSSSNSNGSSVNQQQQDPAQAASSRANSQANNNQDNQQVVQATPALQQAPKSVTSSALQGSGQPQMPQLNNNLSLGNQPITTTLTSFQVRTYTVHNAFKTIFRTITSTVLIPTVLSAGATLLPMLG